MSEICIDFSTPDPKNGKPPVDGRCPECGSCTFTGFGLAYGGYGVYHTCDQCTWFHLESCEE